MNFKNLKINKLGVIALFFSDLIIILDQLSKWAVMELVLRKDEGFGLLDWFSLDPRLIISSYESFRVVEVMPLFNAVLVWNRGISFGMFNDGNMAVTFSVISIIISLGLSIWMIFAKDKYIIMSLALIIGGALGNVIDRLRFGAVIDFMDFYIGKYHWPAFNLADSAIVVGALIMLFITIRNDDEGLINENK